MTYVLCANAYAGQSKVGKLASLLLIYHEHTHFPLLYLIFRRGITEVRRVGDAHIAHDTM